MSGVVGAFPQREEFVRGSLGHARGGSGVLPVWWGPFDAAQDRVPHGFALWEWLTESEDFAALRFAPFASLRTNGGGRFAQAHSGRLGVLHLGVYALRSGRCTRLRMLGMWAAQDARYGGFAQDASDGGRSGCSVWGLAQDARRWAAPSLFVSPVKTWRGLTSVRPERSGAESKGWALRLGSGQGGLAHLGWPTRGPPS